MGKNTKIDLIKIVQLQTEMKMLRCDVVRRTASNWIKGAALWFMLQAILIYSPPPHHVHGCFSRVFRPKGLHLRVDLSQNGQLMIHIIFSPCQKLCKADITKGPRSDVAQHILLDWSFGRTSETWIMLREDSDSGKMALGGSFHIDWRFNDPN